MPRSADTSSDCRYRSTLASRLNDKLSGAIICVMQRLHQYDLAGMLIDSGDWQQLKLPAIATEDQFIPLPRGKWHHRRVGDILDPEREPREALDEALAMLGSCDFAAQYQQEPVPAFGNIIKAAWLRFYDPAALAPTPRFVVQSWDTASKTNPQSDWSVCITVLIRGRDIYVLDVMRARLEFPDLHRRAGELAREYGANALLIEDQASGTQLIQTLRAEAGKGVPTPIARRPEGDKLSRVHGISSMIEAGRLHLPLEAPWLAGFLSELLAFPSGRHDDQVDALSQLLEWVRQRDSMQPAIGAMPIIVSGPRQYGPC